MKCRICGGDAPRLFEALILNRYQIEYYKCPNCSFIQTEEPYWLEEAYSQAVSDLDVGLVSRNLMYSPSVENIIKQSFRHDAKFLDYGGGYGLFVRLMRDKGFDFYRQDVYCENLFAKNYDITDLQPSSNFEILTAFEVAEHLSNPLDEFRTMLKLSDNILFSTELQPSQQLLSANDWWYFVPETGQHISLYSFKTLQHIAASLDCYLFSNQSLHLFSRRNFSKNPLLFDASKGNNVDMNRRLEYDFHLSKAVSAESARLGHEYISDVRNGDKADIIIQKVNKSLALSRGLLSISKEELALTKTDLDASKEELVLTKTDLDASRTELALAKTDLDASRAELALTKTDLDATRAELALSRQDLALTVAELSLARIKLKETWESTKWKFAEFQDRLATRLFPRGSARRRLGASVLRHFVVGGNQGKGLL
jgi:2-polyprenyl-3-methyl-5-hydroxy-6-metoxy-1,4-benzoquinol methylase